MTSEERQETPRQTLQEMLRREDEDQFRLLVDQVQDYAIFLLDPSGHVATWNAGAERIKGYTAQEIIGKPYATFFTAEDRAAGKPDRLMRRAREQGRVEDEGWRVRKDGSRFWADAVITALHDSKGNLRGYAKVTRDLTERRQLEEQRYLIQALQAMAEARDRALAEVEADRERLQRFIGVVAHDLRNPLTAIHASAQIVARRGTPPDRLRRAATVIQDQSRRMSAMIESLVEAARIGAGELRTQPAPMDLVALARQVIEARQITTTRHTIILEAPERLEGEWDALRLARVLENLIGNAVKYSPDGGEIRVRIERQDDEATISVTDQGLGFSCEDLPRLFQLFSRAKSAGAIEGTGLGLYIARGFVEAHGGRIWAESAGPGKGSTFHVMLPLHPPS